ncbi:hypothetical protein [Celeribacter halophilus]|uniref:hypothetical protein n=1 Tax=Celeribacter halophilus TaxID=576117 RepID=UPI003A8DF7D9
MTGSVSKLFQPFELLDDDAAEQISWLIELYAWRYRKTTPAQENRRVDLVRPLDGMAGYRRLSLAIYLSAKDKEFFELAKVSAARALRAKDGLRPEIRLMASELLVAESPSGRKPNLGRNLILVFLLSAGLRAGFRPTKGSHASGQKDVWTGHWLNDKLTQRFGISIPINRINKVWEQREKTMREAGFGEAAVYEFFSELFERSEQAE